MKILSVIVPCFNEEQALPFFYEEIKKISVKMKDVSFEYLFIDDGSNDNTLSVIKNILKWMKELNIYLFQEILVKKQRFMLA